MKCAVVGCESNDKSEGFTESGIKFFRFPTDANMVKAWKDACCRKDIFNGKSSKVCSRHFKKSDYLYNLKHELLGYCPKNYRALKPDAIPSENLPCKQIVVTSRTRKRRNGKEKGDTDQLQTCNSIVDISDSKIALENMENKVDFEHKNMEIENVSVKVEQTDFEYTPTFQCRTCLKSIEATACVPINQNLFYDKAAKELIVFLVPEMHSKLRDDEVICDECVNILKSTMEFIVKCLEVESVLEKKEKIDEETCKSETEELQRSVVIDDEHDYCVKEEAVDDYGEESEPNEGKSPLPNVKLEKIPKLTCTTCLESFPTKEEYDVHMDFHPPYACELCGKSYKKIASLRAHKFSHNDPNSFICEICGKGFKKIHALRAHHKNHVSVMSYKCEECPKVFKTKNVLSRHVQLVHEKVRKMQCTICGILSYGRYSLKLHMNLVHFKEKPFECNICQKRFGRSDYLQNHKLRHAKAGRLRYRVEHGMRNRYDTQSLEELLPCKFCGKKYKGVFILRRHLLLHLKRWPCKYCPLTFAHSARRKRHEESHKGGTVNYFRCNVCWKKFNAKEILDKHVAIHNKPQHSCDACGETFNRKFLLNQHKLKEHTDMSDVKQIDTIIQETLLEAGIL